MSRKILVTGGASGVGEAFCRAWLDTNPDFAELLIIDTSEPPQDLLTLGGVYWWNLDVRHLADLQLQSFKADFDPDTIVQCAGINGICPFDELTDDLWSEVMDVNARGLWHVVQSFLPSLLKAETPLVMNVISNASHMPMTDSCAYNASKGAAHIMTLQMARELTRKHGISVIGISPNKLAGTRMSDYIDSQVMETRGWTYEQALDYQRQALLWRQETPVAALADLMVKILSSPETARWLSGCVIPFGA